MQKSERKREKQDANNCQRISVKIKVLDVQK